jgi:hypothetical protein
MQVLPCTHAESARLAMLETCHRETVSVVQIDVGTEIAQCKKADCEMGWVRTEFFTDLHIRY